MAVRLSASRAGLPLPQEDSWYSFLLEAESTPGLEGLSQLKITMTSSRIEPATFQLAAQCLNQLRYCVVNHIKITIYVCLLGITGFLDLVIRPGILKNKTFRKLHLFTSSGEEWQTPNL
jgi:hypothetical protein